MLGNTVPRTQATAHINATSPLGEVVAARQIFGARIHRLRIYQVTAVERFALVFGNALERLRLGRKPEDLTGSGGATLRQKGGGKIRKVGEHRFGVCPCLGGHRRDQKAVTSVTDSRLEKYLEVQIAEAL